MGREADLVGCSVTFGAITDTLEQQLRSQGFGVTDDAELGRIQIIADAISTVAVHRFMSPSQSDKARTKLAKRLWKIVRPIPAPDCAGSPASPSAPPARCPLCGSDEVATRPARDEDGPLTEGVCSTCNSVFEVIDV